MPLVYDFQVLMGHESMNIFQILLPAVVLHGTFDFVLFLMGVIGAAYEVCDNNYTVNILWHYIVKISCWLMFWQLIYALLLFSNY